MLKIRLQRTGRRLKPIYHIVVAKASSKRDGKYVTHLGFYNPFSKHLEVNAKQVAKFLDDGSYPTNRVRHLLYKLVAA